MIIQYIKICNLGAIDDWSHDFNDGVNIVKIDHTDEILSALQLILNHKTTSLPQLRAGGNTKIEACVLIADKTYLLKVCPTPPQNNLCLCAYDEGGNEKTQEYLYLTSHCAEQDLSEFFCKDPPKMLFKPIQYLDEDRYYAANELSKQTDRLSETKAFRSYLKKFVAEFKPEQIREGKKYELCLAPNGKYVVHCKDDGNMPALLSETEHRLFRYLCFLKTAEFWQGFEEIRNLHSVKKTILVENFLERLDESVDIPSILKRTTELKRQVIILTT